MLRLTFFIIFLLLGYTAQAQVEDAEPYDLGNVSGMMDKAREDAANMTLPTNIYSEAGKKAARETVEVFHSPEFQQRLQCEQERLEEEVFGEYTTALKKKKQQQDREQSGTLADSERVYLFISSSVPDEIVHNYLADIARAGDPNFFPVMRGVVRRRGDPKANVEYFSRILKEDPDCRDEKEIQKRCRRFQVPIKMNPPLFTKYGITRVPAVVYENEQDAFLIQGDVGLDYFLEQVNREAQSASLSALINKMRGEP